MLKVEMNLKDLLRKTEMAQRIISNCSAYKGLLLPTWYKGSKEDFFKLVQNNRRFVEPCTVFDSAGPVGITYSGAEFLHAIRNFADAGDPLAEKIQAYMDKMLDFSKGLLTGGYSGLKIINSRHKIIEKLITRQMTEEEYNRYLNMDLKELEIFAQQSVFGGLDSIIRKLRGEKEPTVN